MEQLNELLKKQKDMEKTFRERIKCDNPQRQKVIGHNPQLGNKVRGSEIPPKGVIVTKRSSSYGGESWEGYKGFGNLEPLKKRDGQPDAKICREWHEATEK